MLSKAVYELSKFWLSYSRIDFSNETRLEHESIRIMKLQVFFE